MKENSREAYSEALKTSLTETGTFIRSQFDDVSKERRGLEDRFLRDLRQYKGVYDPEVSKKLSKSRSRLFTRITRTKIKAFDARIMEMLFPANNDRNWEINPTPRPDMVMSPIAAMMIQQATEQKIMSVAEQVAQEHESSVEDALAFVQSQGVQLDPEEVLEVSEQAAAKTCDAMRTEIADQLAEIKYRDICANVIHSGNLYGTGIIKGPLVQKKQYQQWQANEQEQWGLGHTEKALPFLENVKVWDFYPDPEATDLKECEFMYQRHLMSRDRLVELANMPGFQDHRDTMIQYLKDFPTGDATVREWETELQETDERNDTKQRLPNKRYEVLEFWGSLNGSQMLELGFEGEDLNPDDTRWINLWVLGEFVIKATATPIEGMDHLYHIYYFDKDETSFWGEGLASLMRDDQEGVNASTRAMMDNAARTVGPMWEMNVDLLPPGERTRDVHPDRMIFRRGSPQAPAIRAVQTESRIKEYMVLRDTFQNNIHENTVPSYMHGENDNGVGRTVGGLSMLMGAANVNIKEQIRHFDDGITRSVIRGFYNWNMMFNPNPMIKGDYDVVARGSTSLVAKELRAQQLDQLFPIVTAPQFMPFINNRILLGEMFKARDLDDTEILLSEEQANDRSLMQQQVSQLQDQLAWFQAFVQKMHTDYPSLARQVTDDVKPGDVQNFRQGGMAQTTAQG